MIIYEVEKKKGIKGSFTGLTKYLTNSKVLFRDVCFDSVLVSVSGVDDLSDESITVFCALMHARYNLPKC